MNYQYSFEVPYCYKYSTYIVPRNPILIVIRPLYILVREDADIMVGILVKRPLVDPGKMLQQKYIGVKGDLF